MKNLRLRNLIYFASSLMIWLNGSVMCAPGAIAALISLLAIVATFCLKDKTIWTKTNTTTGPALTA